MPVIVVGADTEIGLASIDGLLARQGEVRAFVTDSDREEVHAHREVVLCAGAIDTPKLLMLSGIGPADELACGWNHRRQRSARRRSQPCRIT